MTDKIFIKIQNDIKNSNPIIINNDDNISNIKKNLSAKYTEDISDSDDDKSSYRKRNNIIINNINAKTKIKIKKDNISAVSNTENTKETKETKETKKTKETEETEETPYEFQEDLTNKVKEYVKSDNAIRELQQKIKELTVTKKNAEQDILKHLTKIGDTNINITGGKLRINQYESKEGFKEDLVKSVMTDTIKDPKIIENILVNVNEKRIQNAKIQVSLKRTFEKKK